MAEPNDTTAMVWPYIEKLEVTRWVACTIWLLVFTVGVPSNLLILCAYRAKKMKSTGHVFIGALAVADLLLCLLRLPDVAFIVRASTYLDYRMEGGAYFISTGLLYTTSLLTLCIALDRFDSVCRSVRRLGTVRRAKVAVAVCFVASLAAMVPEVVHTIRQQFSGEARDRSVESVLKFIPVCLYIFSLVTVTALYAAVFWFVRKRRVTMAAPLQPGPAAAAIGPTPVVDAASPDPPRPTATATVSSPGPERHYAWIRPEGRQPRALWRVAPAETSGPSQELTAVLFSRASASDSQLAANARAPAAFKSKVTAAASGSQRRGRGVTMSERAESRMTKMMSITTLTFFFLWFPYVSLKVYALGGLYVDFLKSTYHANLVAAMLVLRDVTYLNSVVNAFIYGMANRRYRAELKTVVRMLRQRVCCTSAE